MIRDRALHISFGLCTAILIVAALYFARPIFGPVAFSLFIIAIIWPLQSVLQAKMPKLLALAITILATVVVVTLLASMIVWGFSVVGQWVFKNAARFQVLYGQTTNWLEGHGVLVAGVLLEYFNVNWLIRAFQQLTGRIQGFLSFALITLTFVLLGLLEVDIARKNIESLDDREFG